MTKTVKQKIGQNCCISNSDEPDQQADQDLVYGLYVF